MSRGAESPVPIPDHASLNVAVTFSGLSNDEATTVLNNLPDGSTATVVVRKPAIGGKRFEIAAERLSVQGARDLTTAAFLHVQWVASGGSVDYGRVPEPATDQAGGA